MGYRKNIQKRRNILNINVDAFKKSRINITKWDICKTYIYPISSENVRGSQPFFAEELFLTKFWIEEPYFEEKFFLGNPKLFFNNKISYF
jgi:hypothetical protein